MPELDEWVELPEFEGHEINALGEIRNKKNKRVMSTSTNQSGVRYVTMRNTVLGRYQNRALSTLVAETFCPHRGEITLWGGANDTVVHLDGDQNNVMASNLVWAPRWFAIAFHQQVNDPKWQAKKRIVEGSGRIYRSYAHAATNTACLPNAIQYAVQYNDGLASDEHPNLVHKVAGGYIFRSI